MDGVLLVDKPIGPTSHDVVAAVRRALKTKKVGHTGTLDPMASGVLPLCIGEATKLVQFVVEGDKTYRATVALGVRTDTYDAQGQVTARATVPPLSRAQLEAALSKFRGTFDQLPPMFSAVKIDGKKLYEHARAGEVVERAARPVTVRRLELLGHEASSLELEIDCSKGFFVRALADDLGEALGCGAHLSALRRTRVGTFTIEQSIPLATLEAGGPAVASGRLISLENAVSGLPDLVVDEAAARKVRCGGAVTVSNPPDTYRVSDSAGRLLAIADVVDNKLKYRRVFAPTS